ncbi:hypothetical protein GWI33_010416 [Rhynchophorus ferrugineus]|uniref:Uncharacterized protein n=1 Tax=Rhynchophorus ferrugineus TaxID=354439 RepID=A0A834MJQ4_RHYFE|nr:hypothetical protein GWI33_010416 [Rhynchophorus ferrugineus]
MASIRNVIRQQSSGEQFGLLLSLNEPYEIRSQLFRPERLRACLCVHAWDYRTFFLRGLSDRDREGDSWSSPTTREPGDATAEEGKETKDDDEKSLQEPLTRHQIFKNSQMGEDGRAQWTVAGIQSDCLEMFKY